MSHAAGPAGPRLISPALLRPDEHLLLELKPSLLMIVLVSYRTLFWAALLAVVNMYVDADRLVGSGARLAVGAVAVGGGLLRVLLASLDWIGRIYVLTDRRVIRQRGFVNVNVFECDLSRLQNTYLNFTWEQRLLGLGTLAFVTAGTGGVEALWAHVEHPLQVHARVREALDERSRAPAGPGAGRDANSADADPGCV